MSKHTPGPWWLDHGDDVNLFNHVGISAETHELLAQVVWRLDDDKSTPECEANARLIAAAPDLLEALETALYGWQREFEYLAKRTPEWVTKARAAIAKATGEQQ